MKPGPGDRAGTISLGRAETLARLVTDDRRPFLDRSLTSILAGGRDIGDDRGFTALVRHWAPGNWVATDRHGTTWTGRPTPLASTGPPRPPDRPAHQDAA